MLRQALATRTSIPAGWRIIRSSDRQLLENARTSYAALPAAPTRRMPLAIRVSGTADGPLQVTFSADGKSITVRSKIILVASAKYALNCATLREQLGRLGDTPFILTTLDDAALAPGLFLPISELNRLRQRATEELTQRCDSSHQAVLVERAERVRAAARDIAALQAHGPGHRALDEQDTTWGLTAQVYRTEDALAAAESGATEVCFDPFLRHPPLSIAKLRQLESSLLSLGVTLRLRTPTIVRPAERRSIGKWLDFGSPILSGHLGLIAELGRAGRDITADYAVNVMNAHSAAELFRLRARRIVLSVELTADEIALLVAPWKGRAFDVLVYGRPEGMTIEHCVLSAAFDRVPTTCRDLCVQKHPNIELTDPAGYRFPVATDSACRNRLLHSRPIEGSEFLPKLWSAGIRGYHAVFNVPGDPVREIVAGYRQTIERIAAGERQSGSPVRAVVGDVFTRGHFARAV